MTDTLEAQIGTYQHRLDHLLRDGQLLHSSLLAPDRDFRRELDALRLWQRECAATISQLSGGSKQHWLSRAFSQAFLPTVPAPDGGEQAAQEAPLDALVERIMVVLREAQASLATLREEGASAAPVAPAPRRFEFVHDAALRPRLEHAFADAESAFREGAYALALVTWASMLEALLTDALQHPRNADVRPVDGDLLAGMSFNERIGAAEQARLISLGCARLPQSAREYQHLLDPGGSLKAGVEISEQDARRTGQVLRLIMRDLAPGR